MSDTNKIGRFVNFELRKSITSLKYFYKIDSEFVALCAQIDFRLCLKNVNYQDISMQC